MLSPAIRRRLAIGLAGAMLGATLISGVAQVSADEDVNPASDWDRPSDREPAANSGTLVTLVTVVQSQSAPVVSDDAAVMPAQGINQIENNPDDRN